MGRYTLIGMDGELRAIKRAVTLDIPVLAIGHTGCGKTTAIQHVANSMNKRLVRISLNGEMGIPELVGKWLVRDGATVWQDGIIVEAMRSGDWIVLDEINAALPEVLFCLNSIMDDARALTISEKDGELVQAHEDFRVFASMNPSGEYGGTKELNMALISRFGVVLEVDYQPPQKELEIIKQTGLAEDMCKLVIDVGGILRKSYKQNITTHMVSTRDLINLARLLKDGAPMIDALEWAIINKINKEERVQAVERIKSGITLQINWRASADTVMKNLTEDLALSVKDLQTKKSELEQKLLQLEANVQSVLGYLKPAVQ